MDIFIRFLFKGGTTLWHIKNILKRRRSPIRFLFLLILLIAVLIGIVVFMLHSKLGKVQTKALDQSF